MRQHKNALLHFGWLAAALLTIAAGPLSNPNAPYPYAPQFVLPEDVPPTVLKEPPRPGSKEYKKELELVVTNQKSMTKEKADIVMGESEVWPEMITLPALGDDFTEEEYPATYQLLKHAGSDSWRISDETRYYWKSVRPWLADKRVKLYVKPIETPSYPSGHTVTNHVWASILSDLMPEHRQKLFRRADEIANHRIDGGVHYMFDIKAGHFMGDKLYQQMLGSLAFRREFRAACIEIRGKEHHLPTVSTRRCLPSLAAAPR